MATSFDLENEKHSFEKCELVRILSTTITRSNSEFAKLSFDGIYDSITYIGNCYQSLWQEWCDSKILENDILKDTSKWDRWMIEYYNNCKSDYFNTMSEMYCLMQFHTQSMNGDYSWAFKIENLNIIQNHNGLVTTKLVNKLEYLLKKHNFGSLKLEQKDQKYRTRKRGGCKKCNQIRDIKKMLENYIHLQPKQLECNNSDNTSENETGAASAAAGQGIPMMVTYSGQANSATGQGWKTTEIISNNINNNNNNNKKKNKENVIDMNNLNNVAINPFQINQLYLPQTEEQIHTGYHTTEVIPVMTIMNNNNNNNNNVSSHFSNENHHSSSDDSSSSSGSHHSAQNSSDNSKTPALSVSLLNSDESMADDFNLNFNGNNNNNNIHLSGNESSDDDDETISILKELNDLNVELTPTPPPPGQDSLLLFESVPNVEDILASVVADVITPNDEESKEYELKCYDIMSQQKKENNVIVPEWYDINKLFSNSGKGSNSNLEEEIAMPDPNVKEWSFEPIDISECKYGELLEMSKPSVIKDNDFGSYLYYIPREYLCNIKIVRQFELAIENLTRWSMNNNNNNNNVNSINGDNNEEAWYTHNDNNNKFNFDYNNNVLRNISPEWLLGTEIKLIDLLSKFPQLNDIVRNNVPNSCLMKKFENGNNFSQLNTINPNYYNTKSEDYASINMFLGGTRTLAIGSMVRNQVFGLNVRFGDLCIMAGKFESCYKHGIPMQSNVNETTLQLSFAKIQSQN